MTVLKHDPYQTLAFFAILVVAALLRFAILTAMPYGLWVDEAWFGAKGREVLSGENYLPLAEPGLGVGNSAWQIYAVAAAQAVGIAAAYSSRVVSAICGFLAVFALYPALLVLTHDVFDSKARKIGALSAIAFYATNFSAVLYSRSGGQQAASALFAIVTITFIYITFDQRTIKVALLTGFVMGISLTTYEAAYALPIILVIYVGLRLMDAQRGLTLWLGLIVSAVALATMTPLIWSYMARPGILITHMTDVGWQQTGLGYLSKALIGFVQTWLGVSVSGDFLPVRNLPYRPMFDPLASILIFMGGLWLLRRARRQGGIQLLLLWSLAMSLPSAVTQGPPSFTRMVAMTPALAGVAGVGVTALMGWLPRYPRAIIASVTAVVVITCAITTYDYFVRWPTTRGVFDAFYAGARLTADKARAADEAGDDVWLMPRTQEYVRNIFALLLDKSDVRILDASSCLPYPDRLGRAVTYGVVTILDRTTLPTLHTVYPGERESAVMHPDGYAFSVFLHIPPGTPAPSPKNVTNVRFENGVQLVGFDLSRNRFRAGETVNLSVYWTTSEPVRGEWIGFIHIGQGDTSDPLIGAQDSLVCPGLPSPLFAPGYVFIEQRAIQLSPDASPGDNYDIRVGVYHASDQHRGTITSTDIPAENGRAILSAISVEKP